MEDMIRRGLAKTLGNDTKEFISAYDADRVVQMLKLLTISEVGSPKWMEQHDSIEKLNLQAHQNARVHADEFVLEALLSHDKLAVLMHQLLVAEVWKEKALPLLVAHLSSAVDSVTAYQLLYHEAVVANLLEVCLFHHDALQALSDDSLLELCDWCYRKLVYLNTCNRAQPAQQVSTQELLAKSPEAELAEKREQMDFSTALCGLTLTRYLTDAVNALPLSVMARLASTNDTVMALLPLIERPPWCRRTGRCEQKYIDGAWRDVQPADRLKLTQHDAQAWLALNNLVVDPGCRARTLTCAPRCEALLRLRRLLGDALLDQLPVLRDLRRALEEAALGLAGSCTPDLAPPAQLVIEQVPVLREALLRGMDWEALAAQQKHDWFGPESAALSQSRMQEMLEAFDFMADMLPADGADKENEAPQEQASDGQVRCRFWRHVKEDVYEEWSDMGFAVDTSRAAETVEVRGSDDGCVRGKRYRLQGVQLDASKPLPCNGKVVARYRGHTAEARLQLPVASTRAAASEELAAIGWLTIGLLVTDGIAVQLRLGRADRPTMRDKEHGAWLAYHTVGGAVTVVSSGDDAKLPAGPLAF